MSAQACQDTQERARLAQGLDRGACAPATPTNGLSVLVRERSTSTVITPIGELDLATVEEFDHVLWGAQKRDRHVVIDLRALEFIDCAGIRSLVGGQLRASSWLGHLEVMCTGGQVRRLLALTGVDQVIDVTAPVSPLASLPVDTNSAAAGADERPRRNLG